MIKLLLPLVAISGLTAAVSFVLYARARMKEQEQKEKLFLKIHYTAITIVCLLGVVYMMVMVNTDN